ncbi:MAG: hypothetical protein HKO98_08130 [Gemmatimonadetes bacterium]|nr:hypothetical protein [Gemmatimonadota bacterium]
MPNRFVIPVVVAVFLAACGGDGGTQPNPPGGGGDGGGDGGGGSTPPVAAPSGLAVEALSSSRLRVNWTDNSSDETAFDLERSPDGAAWASVATLDPNTTTYDDRGLAEGARFVYRVRAVVGTRQSDWASVAEATTLAGSQGDVLEIETVINETLPPAGTPITERNLLDEVRATAAAVIGLPGVDTVLVIEAMLSSVALLDDGSLHLFVHNRLPGADDAVGGIPVVDLPPASAVTGADRSSPGPRGVSGPPRSARAVVASYDGGAATASKVANMLSSAGYELLSLDASVDAMRQYTNLGALYLDTHGTAAIRPRRRADGTLDTSEQVFALETATKVRGFNLSAYTTELESGVLTYLSSVNADGTTTSKLAITERFIAAHWSFADGVVMVHACYAGAGPFTQGGLDLDPTILQLATLGAGADVFVSFDHLTWASYAEPSIVFFWDRLLGADTYDRKDPPLRPFPVPEVQAAMGTEGLLEFTRPNMSFLGIGIGGNTVNVTFDGGSEQTTLAPSIREIDMVDDVAQGDGTLTAHGWFGDRQGTVEVEGTSVTVQSWSPETVVARVPFEASGSAGPIVVKTPDDIESNEVPLTEWRGTLTATTDLVGNVQAQAEVDFRFRADVHGFRTSATGDPQNRIVDVYMNPASSGTSRGSGSHTYSDGSTLSASGSYDLRILNKAEIDSRIVPPTSSVLGATIQLRPDAGEAEICVILWGEVDVASDASPPQRTVLVYGSAPFLVQGGSLGLFGCATVSMDRSSFRIDSFSKEFQSDDVTYRIEWTEMIPFAAPDGRTAG